VDNFVAEFITGGVIEPVAGAMAEDQVIRIDVFQGGEDLADCPSSEFLGHSTA
jgi:hypothetical protein